MRKTLNEIKEDWTYESQRLPGFINQSDEDDYRIYSRMRRILKNILLLVDNTYLDQVEIDLILDSCSQCSLEINDVFSIKNMNEVKDNRILLIADYIISFVDGLKEDLLEEEFYESVVNISKFEKLFYSLEI